MVRVLLLLGALFVSDNLFQTLLPVSLEANGISSGVLVGAFLAVSQGLGILVSPPAAAWGDSNGRGPILRAGAIGLALSTSLIGVAAAGAAWWLWLLPILLYGISRTSSIATAIALVSSTGDPLHIQGLNGAVQRGAAAAAAVAAALVVTFSAWQWGFWTMTAVTAFAACLAMGAAPRRPPDAGAVPPLSSYRRSASMLIRERPIQASSLINVNNFAVTLLGNSFFPLALDVPHSELGGWILALLLCRDVTSVLSGPAFRPLARRLGLRAVIIIIGCCNVGGLVMVALVGANVAGVIAAALLQGFAMSLAIGSTNIMATRSGSGGSGLRIVATNYVNSTAALVLPIGFGAVFDVAGGRVLFLVGAGVVALLIIGVLRLARDWMASSRAALSNGLRDDV